MDKLAQIRDSEVRGVLAAFVDNGLIKCASREDFDNLAEAVSANVGYDYDINTIADVTDALLSDDNVKTAGEQDDEGADEGIADCMSAIGELYMRKTAGEIDDITFEEAADDLLKEAGVVDTLMKRIRPSRSARAKKYLKNKFKNGSKARNAALIGGGALLALGGRKAAPYVGRAARAAGSKAAPYASKAVSKAKSLGVNGAGTIRSTQ